MRLNLRELSKLRAWGSPSQQSRQVCRRDMIRTGIQGRRTAHVCAKAKAPTSQTSQVLLCVLALTKTLQILHLQKLPRIDNRVQSQGISPTFSNASIEYPLTSIQYPENNHATSPPPTHTHNDTDRQRERDRQTDWEAGRKSKGKRNRCRDRQSRSIRETERQTVDKEVSD